jgi:hypothetical protein
MSDKEAVLEMMRHLPAEVSLSEIRQGIEKIALAQNHSPDTQVSHLRSSTTAASILSQALAAHHGSTN